MKYRLILEELARNTLYEDSPSANAMLESALESIKENLDKLDCKHTVAKSRASSSELWKRLVFEQEVPHFCFHYYIFIALTTVTLFLLLYRLALSLNILEERSYVEL